MEICDECGKAIKRNSKESIDMGYGDDNRYFCNQKCFDKNKLLVSLVTI